MYQQCDMVAAAHFGTEVGIDETAVVIEFEVFHESVFAGLNGKTHQCRHVLAEIGNDIGKGGAFGPA